MEAVVRNDVVVIHKEETESRTALVLRRQRTRREGSYRFEKYVKRIHYYQADPTKIITLVLYSITVPYV